MRWLLVLGLVSRLIAGSFDEMVPSSPEEILALTGELLVDRYVSAASGQLVLSETDLCVKGAQDLVLKRTYVPPQILGRYAEGEQANLRALGMALSQLTTKGWVVHPHLVVGYGLHSSYFQVRDPQGFVLGFEIQDNRGVLKTASYGCSNLRGGEPTSAADIRNIELWVEGDWVRVVWPDGVQRYYEKEYVGVYRLKKEVLPSGKMICYAYDANGLARIFACDLTGTRTYGSIARIGDHRYRGSDGREVELTYETRGIKSKIREKGHRGEIAFNFQLMTRASHPEYSHTVGFNDRMLLDAYDAKEYRITCDYSRNKDELARIQTLSTFSGATSFSYDPAVADQKGGSTTVTHPSGAQTIYRFNKLLLLEAIERWGQGELVNRRIFAYDEKQHVKNMEMRGSKGQLLIAKRFECDRAGNPEWEQREGDFGVFSIRRKYDKNRLVYEERDDGLQYVVNYLGDTWLVRSKETLEHGKVLRKIVYHYDDANNLILEEEIGRTKTQYRLYQGGPFLDRVEWEEKYDWDGQLIGRIHFVYDQWGNAAQERHFGSDGILAYTIERTYNEKGELCKETNALGDVASYSYNARGRCDHEVSFGGKLTIERNFDQKGRLRLFKEGGHETRYNYNSSDELSEKINYLKEKTEYRWHPVHSQPEWITESQSITQIVYDDFGREMARIDPYGARIEKRYNSYGDVTQIIHPEAGVETFAYAPNGLLSQYTDPDGLITTYSYDVLKRLREKKVGGHVTVFQYDSYDLYEMIDAAGFVTEYKHDLAGRKIEENRAGRLTRYGYDALGSLSWEERGKRRIEYEHDTLGQLRKKRIDGVLEMRWTYDAGGCVTGFEQGGVTKWKYDEYQRLIEKMDPEGHKTLVRYEEGPQILLVRKTDPLGVETVESYNSHKQLLKKEVVRRKIEERNYDKSYRLSSQDHLTFGYTLNGNREWMQEAEQRITQWTYTPGNKVRAKHKPDGVVLVYDYDAQGRLARVGDRMFCYDSLDRLVGGTGFIRKLDAFGNILREEWTNGLWIETSYDDWDRPIERRLPDHSRIGYEYEGSFLKKVSRLSSDGSELYSHTYDRYDARGNPQEEDGFFKTTYRYDKLGRRIAQDNPYFHETVEYDPVGNLICKGGASYSYDALSQMTSQSDRFFAQYDTSYNLREYNGQKIAVDSLNQIDGMLYDRNGNLIREGFLYDDFDQLIEASGEKMVYDALGRRLQKGSVAYLYVDQEEIGAFATGIPKELKVLGGGESVAIEIDGKAYAPIQDVQGTTRILVDSEMGSVACCNQCDAFGSELTAAIPYAYLGKRYDAKTRLVYFGQRYYDPMLRRWLTPDPIGPEDHSNLYQYVFNNPFAYRDLNGEFAFAIPLLFWGAELAFPTLSACVAPILYGAFTGAIAYGGYKLVETLNEHRIFAVHEQYRESLAFKGNERPPYDGRELGDDPTKPPGKEFEWKGDKPAGSKQGSWYNSEKDESLHPDFNHKPPIKPHWDYQSPDGQGARLFLDGTWEWK